MGLLETSNETMQDRHSEPHCSVSASGRYFFQCIPTAPLDIGIMPVWDNEEDQLAQSQQLLDLGPKQGLWPLDLAPLRAECAPRLPTTRLPGTGS